jgi:uncharacterized protein YggE
MRLAVPLATAILALSGAAAHAQPPQPERPPTVTASGKATVKRAPDRAFVTFATESRAAKPEDAQKANARAMEQVRRELADRRIPDEAIQTTSFYLREDVDWVNGTRVPRGYVVTNAIEVRVDDMERLGGLLDEVVKAGATSVGGIRFDLKNRDQVEREALRLAVADARARAEAAAAGAGTRVVRIHSIEEQGTVDVPKPMAMRMEMAVAADAGPQTPVSGGEIEIVATVRLTAIIDAR